MEEFYFKENNGEVYFFFRNNKKSGLTYEEWTKNCDKIKILKNETLKKLLEFLNLENKSEFNFENLQITMWKNKKYRFTKIDLKGEIKALLGKKTIYELESINELEE